MGFEFTIGMPRHIPMHMPMHMLMSMPTGFAFLINGNDYLPNTAKLRKKFQFFFLNEICGASEAVRKAPPVFVIQRIC